MERVDSPASPPQRSEQLLYLLSGHCLEQALHVAATLGIADLLTHGAKSGDELAIATCADRQSLCRLLRALASIGVFGEDQNGCFSLTALGETLRSDVPDSIRDRVIYCGSEEMWTVWGNLLYSVKTGRSAFEHVYAAPFYEYLDRHPTIGAPFNRYMTKTSEQHIDAILESYDFSSLHTVVDVGGGHGGTLAAILAAYPTLRGVLFDLPLVVGDARQVGAAGVAGRCEMVGGDMQQWVPADGDAYLLKWVLMDRSDEQAIAVLQRCAEAMADHGKILVIEMVMPRRNQRSSIGMMDLQMLFLFGAGRIRTADEFGCLFNAAGLRINQTISTRSPNSIIEGMRI